MEPEEEKPNFFRTVGEEMVAKTQDVSAGGLKFLAHSCIPVGTILETKILLEKDKKPIECMAKVARVEEDNFSVNGASKSKQTEVCCEKLASCPKECLPYQKQWSINASKLLLTCL